MFCGPKTTDVSMGVGQGELQGHGTTKHTAFSRSQ